ncbi:MAG: YigZ family protein, partial [Planctomycetota bacterium]
MADCGWRAAARLDTLARMARYRIPAGRARVELRVSNSRFIATIAPAATMAEAQQILREIRAEMPDATHHVYAFKIGYGASVSEAMSDDGEPSGTSGPPALAVLRGADIGDVALV